MFLESAIVLDKFFEGDWFIAVYLDGCVHGFSARSVDLM